MVCSIGFRVVGKKFVCRVVGNRRWRRQLVQRLLQGEDQRPAAVAADGADAKERHIAGVAVSAEKVADTLGMPYIRVMEVATFYTMFETQKVGRNNVAFCTNISCWLNGAEDLVAHAEKKLGCKLGESTADGRVYLKREEECVAACCGAPVVVINGHYHEKLTPAKVDELLDGLE